MKLAPLFERRLAASGCAGLTESLLINLYREAVRLRFEKGKLSAVERAGFVDASMGADGGDLCIPPDAFVRLVLGYRALDRLADAWPDIVIRPGSRHVLDALFPAVTYCGCPTSITSHCPDACAYGPASNCSPTCPWQRWAFR